MHLVNFVVLVHEYDGAVLDLDQAAAGPSMIRVIWAIRVGWQ